MTKFQHAKKHNIMVTMATYTNLQCRLQDRLKKFFIHKWCLILCVFNWKHDRSSFSFSGCSDCHDFIERFSFSSYQYFGWVLKNTFIVSHLVLNNQNKIQTIYPISIKTLDYNQLARLPFTHIGCLFLFQYKATYFKLFDFVYGYVIFYFLILSLLSDSYLIMGLKFLMI